MYLSSLVRRKGFFVPKQKSLFAGDAWGLMHARHSLAVRGKSNKKTFPQSPTGTKPSSLSLGSSFVLFQKRAISIRVGTMSLGREGRHLPRGSLFLQSEHRKEVNIASSTLTLSQTRHPSQIELHYFGSLMNLPVEALSFHKGKCVSNAARSSYPSP